MNFLLTAGIGWTDKHPGLMLGGAIGSALGGVILLRRLPELISAVEWICTLTGVPAK